MSLAEIRKALTSLGDPLRARKMQRFFKTGPGEYGEGDHFIGVKVPFLRKIARQHQGTEFSAIKELLHSSIHEERFLALVLLVQQYANADRHQQENIYGFYMENISRVNNWDLVDTSAPHIIGAFLHDKDKAPLYRLAVSKNIWKRRIAVMATFYFIRQNCFDDTLKLAEILLPNKEDLIHKAVGWMLREVGNKHLPTEEAFLQKHYKSMPRTMLRYAIEKFTQDKRSLYLTGQI